MIKDRPESQQTMLIKKLKMNYALGIQSKLNQEQVQMIKELKLQNESYMKNVKIVNVTNREEYEMRKNDAIRFVLVLTDIL